MPNLINDDEYIIIFNDQHKPIDRQGYVDLASAGIKTALNHVEWIFIEQTPGHYDWSEPDDFVDNCVHSGLKGLLATPNCATACMPDDWYCQTEKGFVHRQYPEYSIFSPWNTEAQAYQDSFVQMVMERYKSYPVQVIRGGTHGGESLLPYEASYFDPAAVDSFRVWVSSKFRGELQTFNREEGTSFPSWEQVKPSTFVFAKGDHRPITKLWLREHLTNMVVRQQQQIVSRYRSEAWLMLAACWQDVMQTGNFLIPDIAQIIMERVQPTHINWIAFAHFNMNSTLQNMALKRVKDKDVSLWTGSQYCEGLAVNTESAIASGIRGFLTGPLSIEDGHNLSKIEPWMVENIKDSLAKWRAHDGIRTLH